MKPKLLLVTLLTLLCAMSAQADYPAESYQLDGTRLVKWRGNEQEIDFTSDATLSQVTEIAPNAFAYKGNIQRIIFPASLRKICFNAIYECGGLTEVTFAEGLEEIDAEAFYRCPTLQTLLLPASVKSIGEAFVVNCQGIKSYQLVGTNRYYKVIDGVLYNADGTILIAYPAAADGESFAIPESVTRIGDYAFAYSVTLQSIHFSKRVTQLGRKAFYSSTLAGPISIPSSIGVVPDSAFYQCDYITEMTFEEGVQKIGKDAISHCSRIERVSMPSTITELGEGCFSYMNSLLEFRNYMTTPLQGRSIFFRTKKYNATLYVPAESVETYKSQTTTWNAFKNYLSLEDNNQINPSSYKLEDDGRTLVAWSGSETHIDMSQDKVLNRVRTIKAFTFLNKDIKRIVLPEALETIGEGAFQNCESLAEVVTNERLRSIGNRAFWNDFALQSFSFPQSIESVASDAFGYCTGLSKFVMASPNEYYQVVDNVLLSADGSRLVCYAALRGDSYTLPASVTTIEKDAAAGAVGLVTLTLPEGLKEIGESAFQGSSKLTKVHLPASLETFGDGAFMRCKSLEEYSIAAGNAHYAVYGKTLYSADLKTLVAYPEAFSTVAMIPEQVTAIAARAFQRNESLKEVTLPANLRELGDYAFYHCTNLRKVIALMLEPVNPDYTGESPFGEINLKLATLVVPIGSADKYTKATMWSDFGTIMEGDTPVAEGVITMTTTIPVGEKIFFVALNVNNNSSTIEGVRIEGKDMIVDQPTITIRGDIATLVAAQCHLTQIDVTGAPHLTTLYLQKNQLTELDLSQSALLESVILAHNKLQTIQWTAMPNLTALFLYDNKLTSVDLTGMSQLTTLHIYNNQIGANAMEQIVNALPQRNPEDKANFMAIDTQNANEGNRFEDRFFSITTPKNWTIYDYAGGANEGKGVVYTSIEQQPLTGALRLVVDGAMLQITGASESQIVRLYDLAGGLLYSGRCSAESSCMLSLTDYPAGSYIVTVGDHAERIYIDR